MSTLVQNVVLQGAEALAIAKRDDPQENLYNYTPTRSVCIIFLVLFGLSTIIHAGQSVYYRMWWLLPTAVLAGICETGGWSARLWSNINVNNVSPYEMQLVMTIIAPTPLVAANFTILGIIIKELGTHYSRLGPKWYLIVFCTCDIIALVIQAIGGGSAADAVSTNGDATKGGNIMLGGIVFQLAAIIAYVLCELEFFLRYIQDRPFRKAALVNGKSARGVLSPKIQVMVYVLLFSTVCLFIRSVYRTCELADGWVGHIIQTQILFNVCDGAMIVLAMWALNLGHPGWLLPLPASVPTKDIEAVAAEGAVEKNISQEELERERENDTTAVTTPREHSIEREGKQSSS